MATDDEHGERDKHDKHSEPERLRADPRIARIEHFRKMIGRLVASTIGSGFYDRADKKALALQLVTDGMGAANAIVEAMSGLAWALIDLQRDYVAAADREGKLDVAVTTVTLLREMTKDDIDAFIEGLRQLHADIYRPTQPSSSGRLN